MENKQILLEAFGEVSAIFMTNTQRGTDVIMPSERLKEIADRTALRLKDENNTEKQLKRIADSMEEVVNLVTIGTKTGMNHIEYGKIPKPIINGWMLLQKKL